MKNLSISLLLLLTFTSNYTYSQSSLSDEAIKNAEYVFEGVVIDYAIIPDTNESHFVSYTINVIKLLKGEKDISSGQTIELVSPLPDKWIVLDNGKIVQRHNYKSNGLHITPKALAVFVVNKNTTNKSAGKALPSLMPYCGLDNCYFKMIPSKNYDSQKHKEYTTYSIEGFDEKFQSKDEFNQYLKKMNLLLLFDETKK